MATNPRQIQAFETNPMFIWQHFPEVESYTFRLDKKCSPSSLDWEKVWEKTLEVSEASEISGVPEVAEIPEVLKLEIFVPKDLDTKFGIFTYPKKVLPPLDELVSYRFSGTAKSQCDILHAQADMVILESSTRMLFANLESKIEQLNDEALEKVFYDFFENLTMGEISFPGPRWPLHCYSITYSSEV
jgi:hypothetical protein